MRGNSKQIQPKPCNWQKATFHIRCNTIDNKLKQNICNWVYITIVCYDINDTKLVIKVFKII
jgi:hypothetical protein